MATPRFTLRQLDLFAAVMATGQIRGAAEQLHLSQAAVSQAMRELAEALDTPLFETRGRRLVPTHAAHRLAALAAEPRDALAHLPARLQAADECLVGPLHIAASSTIVRYLLPEPLAGLTAHHPALHITVSSGNTADVAERVADAEADIGFIEGPAGRDDLTTRHWQTDRLVLIAPADAELADGTAVRLAERWIMREAGSGTRSVFEQRLALAGLAPPTPSLIIDDAGAQVRAVAAGAGLACVSEAASRGAVAAGTIQLFQLADLVFERPLWIVTRPRSAEDPVVARVIQALAAPAQRADPLSGQLSFN